MITLSSVRAALVINRVQCMGGVEVRMQGPGEKEG